MAKKKNSQKKHTFKHATPASATAPATSAAHLNKTAAAAPAGKTAPLAAAAAGGRDFSYVAGDMRRIGLAAVLLVALELVLFYILTHTPVGPAVYNLVKV